MAIGKFTKDNRGMDSGQRERQDHAAAGDMTILSLTETEPWLQQVV
jgi:hypothetical protein